MSAVPTGLSSSYTALIPFSFVPDGIRCVRDMYSRVAGRGCGKATRVRLVPHRTRTGTCSKRRPRRDNVSPFEPGRDRPQRAPRSQSFKTPEKNGDMFQAPPRRDYVSPFGSGRDWPQRARRSQSLKTSEQNGDMFQAPPRRDYVSPLQPEDSHGGLPLHYKGDRRCAPPKGRPGMARGLAGRSAARPE